MKEVLAFMMQDFMHPVFYLPAGAAAAVFTAVLIRISKAVFSRNCIIQWLFDKRTAVFLLIMYLYVLLNEAFFSRPPGSRNTVSLTLFQTWGETAQSHAYVLENVLMFIPFGILISVLAGWSLFKNGVNCILAAALSSTALEAAQWMTMRGHCQLDDVAANTIGAGIGWLLLYCFQALKSKK